MVDASTFRWTDSTWRGIELQGQIILEIHNLAEAHRTLGMLLGYGSMEAQAHLHRAAELEPNNAENMIGLGLAQGAA